MGAAILQGNKARLKRLGGVPEDVRLNLSI